MTTLVERWNKALEELDKSTPTLQRTVEEFFSILDTKEESDSGRVFNPVYISSCRVWETKKLDLLMKKMREMSKDGNSNNI